MALFIAPQFILIHAFKHPGGMVGTMLCKVLTGGCFMWLGATTSAFTMAVIAFERYYAVLHPHSVKGKVTNSKLKVSTAVIRKEQNHYHYVRISVWITFYVKVIKRNLKKLNQSIQSLVLILFTKTITTKVSVTCATLLLF